MKTSLASAVVALLLSLSTFGWTATAAGGPSATPGGWDQVKGKKVLYFTKSAGFEHSVVKRPSPETLSHSERILTELGQKHGFDVTCTKDGTVFTPENLAQWDVVVFYTSDDLFLTGTDKTPAMTPAGKAALLKAIGEGKGFVAVHPATDSFHYKPATPNPSEGFVAHGAKVDPYIAMLGGEFIRHGPQQVAKVSVINPGFPGCEKLGGTFELLDEWYTFKDFAPDMHVILALETRGMQGIDYQRAPFPCSWARFQGKGRVFYTALGHREDVWTNPLFQDSLLGGIGWAAKNVDVTLSRNLTVATPGYAEIQPEKEPAKP